MPTKPSPRLLSIINALPIKEGSRVLEIGCGTGIAAREVARRIGKGKILAIDRSPKAIETATKNAQAEIASGTLQFLQVAIEDFALPAGEPLYDFAIAICIGALDGRHPELEAQALANTRKALKKGGRLYIDGGNPLKEIRL